MIKYQQITKTQKVKNEVQQIAHLTHTKNKCKQTRTTTKKPHKIQNTNQIRGAQESKKSKVNYLNF